MSSVSLYQGRGSPECHQQVLPLLPGSWAAPGTLVHVAGCLVILGLLAGAVDAVQQGLRVSLGA